MLSLSRAATNAANISNSTTRSSCYEQQHPCTDITPYSELVAAVLEHANLVQYIHAVMGSAAHTSTQ